MALKQVDNPQISAQHRQNVKQNEQKVAEYTSLADRLMQRAHQNTFSIPLDEDLQIELFIPSRGDYLDLVKLQTDLMKTASRIEKDGIKDIDEATGSLESVISGWSQINSLVSQLCVDPSLTPDVLSKLRTEDYGALVQGIIKQVQGGEAKTVAFREE